jgi:hypothetical protein
MKITDALKKHENTNTKASGKIAGRLLDDDELELISGGADDPHEIVYWIINGYNGMVVAGPFKNQADAIIKLDKMKKGNPKLNLEVRRGGAEKP